MRTVNHHLSKRGDTYYFIKRIPKDVRSLHDHAQSIRESLKTRNIVTARRMRDVRLGQLEERWAAYRALPTGQHLSREQMRVALDLRRYLLSGSDREGWMEAVNDRTSDLYQDDVPQELDGEVGSKLAGEFHAIASGRKLPTRIAAEQFLTTAKLKPKTRDLYRLRGTNGNGAKH